MALSHSIKSGLAALALLGLSASALAETHVSEAWVRASVPSQQSTGAFMVLKADADSTLVGVDSPVAKTVQIHAMTMDGDVMGMKQLKSLALPAGQEVVLDPNNYHIMLMGLKQQVKEGDQVPLTLIIKSAAGAEESVQVNAAVRPLNAPVTGHEHAHTH